ncbi:hypothetical protein FLA_0172 [Filimonas lacunae]|nr:hypothetical protein FLA_0172 [Filimonas lacunae]
MDTSDWPPRWHCGKWTSFHGWLFIVSDLLIWGAYFTIPAIIIKYLTRRKHQRFIRLYFLFASFILACGTTHFIDAVTFWYPAYRLNAVVRAITAIISWITIFYMIRLLPYYFSLQSPEALEAEVAMRKKAEKELQLKNEQLRNAEIVGQFGHFEWDTTTNNIKTSEGMRLLLDLGEQEDITTIEQYLAFFPPEVRVQQEETLKHCIKDNNFHTHYQDIVTAQNNEKVFLTRGTVVTGADDTVEKVIVTSQNFTEFKKNKELLEESRKIFKNAFDFSSIGMAFVDLNGQWLDVNQSLCDIFGYTKEEMRRLNFMDMTHPDDIAVDMAYVKQLLSHEIENYRMEKRYYKKDGSIIWILLSASLIWKNNQPAYFTSQLVDITANKHLITELESKNIAFKKANKNLQYHIDNITEFNSIISHNLRGPATSLISAVDFLDDCENIEEAKELLSKIKGTSELVIQTLNDLKEVIEIQLNKDIVYTSCNLFQVLQGKLLLFHPAIHATHATITCDFEIEVISFPLVYLENIFQTLISNALTFRKEGQAPTIHISSAQVKDQVVIQFIDNGLGIDMNRHKEEVFKYKRIFHKGYHGRGLGLFLLKSQIEACGGKITWESDGINGSIFTIAV